METEDKAGLTVQNEPEVVFLAQKLGAGMSCIAMFWNIGAKLVHQLLMVVWDTRTFITVRKIRAMLRNEFLPR